VRYMDDFLLWGQSRAELRTALHEVRSYLSDALRLTLKPAQLQPVGLGVSFLGFRVFANRLSLARGSRQRFAGKLRHYHAAYQEGEWSEEEYARRMQALVAFTLLAEANGFRRALIHRFRVLS